MAIIRRPQSPAVERGWDPFEIMRQMLQAEPFTQLARGQGAGGEFIPTFDVKETKDAFVFSADLPGVKEEDLDISLTGNRLTVSGKRESEKREEQDTYYTYERSYGAFSRAFTLPPEADVEHVEANLKDGVLTLRMPKRAEAQARRIEVRKGGGEAQGKAKA